MIITFFSNNFCKNSDLIVRKANLLKSHYFLKIRFWQTSNLVEIWRYILSKVRKSSTYLKILQNFSTSNPKIWSSKKHPSLLNQPLKTLSKKSQTSKLIFVWSSKLVSFFTEHFIVQVHEKNSTFFLHLFILTNRNFQSYFCSIWIHKYK